MHGQQTDKQDAAQELKKLTQTYRDAGTLSFDVRYYYADEKAPAVYLDSVKGSCIMNGSRYRYTLDSTETIFSDNYVIVLYKEDELMYLAKPSAAAPSINPVAMMDSFLAKKDQYTSSIIHEKNNKKIVFDFKENLPYKKAEYVIDNKTGFITKITSVVRTEMLLDPAVQGQAENSVSSYAIVEVMFDHYQKTKTDEKVFDVSRYFKKEADQYVALPPYDSYKIFIGTPNL